MNGGAGSGVAPCLIDARCTLGEAPVWSASRRTLYWLDVAPPSRLFAWNEQTRAVRGWALPELATALTLLESGGLAVASKTGIDAFSPERGALTRLADAPFNMEGLRFNDCGCDPAGRLWTGTMVDNFAGAAQRPPDSGGVLCRFDADLRHTSIAQQFGCPNTFAWSPDGKTMYGADSTARTIYAWSYDVRTGAPTNRRVFAAFPDLGVPDGSAVDVAGGLWNARWRAGCVVRIGPDGQITDRVTVPADLVSSCAFGGEGLRTLFVTTARTGLSDLQLTSQPQAGGVFTIAPRVPGLPRAAFRVTGAPTAGRQKVLAEIRL